MDIAEAKILWNDNGPVRVVSMNDEEGPEERALTNSFGACNIEWAEGTELDRIKMLFSLYVHLTRECGLPAADVHAAFMEIDQYAELVAYQANDVPVID